MLQFAFEEKYKAMPLVFVNNGVELMEYLNSIKLSTCKTTFNHYPKVILFDLNIAKMDGKEALKRIKAEPNFSSITVITLSTTQNEMEVKTCYELGDSSYICKPSNYVNLQDVVDDITAKNF